MHRNNTENGQRKPSHEQSKPSHEQRKPSHEQSRRPRTQHTPMTGAATRLMAIAAALALAIALVACAPASDNVPPTDQQSAGSSSPSTAPSQNTGNEAGNDSPAGSQPETAEPVTLIVFAASSMKETLEAIEGIYKTAAPHVTLVFNFDSSGTLKTQIEEGAECDLFISAAPRQMNELEEIGEVMTSTRIDLLENKVALVVPSGNPKGITGFDSLIAALTGGDILMAMGNSDVPVGQYTQNIFKFFGLDEEELAANGCLSYGSNVKEVTVQVSEASVDCGIVYATDAFSAGLDVVGYATAEMCGQVIYPAAVLNGSENPDAASAFLEYLTGADAVAVFENVGFTRP